MRLARHAIWMAIGIFVVCGHLQTAFGQEPDSVRLPYPFPGSLEGKELPSFQLQNPDGTQIDSESLRGRPLLIEFWATWCAPCVKGLPELARLYEETKCKGLQIVSLDSDHVEGKADQFLAARHYEWPNYHQTDEIGRLLGNWGLPHAMLVDENGKVILDHPEIDAAAIRKELAGFGPQFADGKRSGDPEKRSLEASPDPQR